MYSPTLKRLFDLLVTIPALLMLAPFLLALALLVRRKLGAPALFRQPRPGLHGKPFTLYFQSVQQKKPGAYSAPGLCD